MNQFPQSLADFEGQWQITREIDDRHAGQSLMAEGQAMFTADKAGLIYQEELVISVKGQPPMKGTRGYLWRAQEDGKVAIHFEDGRYFHRLNLGQGNSADHHACDPDSYSAQYDFCGWPVWSVSWRVVGPRKDYIMKSRYSRPKRS